MMREEFLDQLQNALCGLEKEEIDSVLTYYSEMIEDRMEAGMPEEDAVRAMEPVETIAARVLNEAGIEREVAVCPEEKEEEEQDDKQKEIRKKADDVNELVIQADNQRVFLTVSESDDVVLRYRIEENDVYRLHEENGVLTLEHTCGPICRYKLDASKINGDNFFEEMGKFFKGLRLNSIINFSAESVNRCIRVEVPRTFKGKICAKSCNARIMAENLICQNDLELHTSNARVLVNHVSARSLTAVSSNGRIELEDVYLEQQLEGSTSNGRIVADNVTADQSLKLKTSNGRIEVSMLGSKNITLKTSNGSVSGTVRGAAEEYAVSAGTSNAHNNLIDSTSGEKQLVVSTSNGNINIDFAV